MSALSDALDSIHTTITTDSRDWAANKQDAWIYGIVVGWGSAIGEFETKGWWSKEDTNRMRKLNIAMRVAHARGRRKR